MMNYRYIILPLLITATLLLKADNSDPRINYITTYKRIAIDEMQRTGIPASIKLAQGLLESGAGKSVLAINANNHFGIKCGGSWEGGTYFREDDDRDKNGKLIQSCFRQFESASQSYIAHSHFLTNQRRYSALFELAKSDYHGWAKGLRRAGYATDKAYANKLIKIIEEYQLYLFDSESQFEDEPLLALEEPPSAVSIKKPMSKAKSTNTSRSRRVKGKPYRSSKRRVASQRKASPRDKHYVVQEGQTIAKIAAIHDMDEKVLRIRNRLPKDAEVLAGEKIYLRKRISLLNRPAFIRNSNTASRSAENEFIF